MVNHTKQPQWYIKYALQKWFKDELEILPATGYKNTIRHRLMAKWCKSFILVPKPNGKVRLCLDTTRFNQVLIRPVLRGHTLNVIFPKLNNVKCLSLKDVSSGCHNLKLDETSSYLTTFACQFGRHRHKRLPL